MVFWNSFRMDGGRAYVGLAMDECVRAVCMYFRWRSGKWKEKVLISTEKLS